MSNLTLKWGTIKGWDGFDEVQMSILDRFDCMSASCMLDRPDANRREILCELIDTINGEIWNDWDGRLMTKEDAKKYVREYGAKL